jgi:glucose-1-phosphate adenylyltransferase
LNRVLAIVMAGGAGERLLPLTSDQSKAAIRFAGKYRIIDFVLSNCINSGIRQIFVLTQYLSDSLNKHIQDGWGISGSRLGDHIYCVPAQQKAGADWYRGTADAIRQNLDLIKERNTDTILILSGDHIYKMDYLQMVAYHKMKKADLTLSAIRVRAEEAAGRLGVLDVDKKGKVIGFEEKPRHPKTIGNTPDCVLVSMGIYAFEASALREALHGSEDDFGKGTIPRAISRDRKIFAYDYEKKNKIEDFVVEMREGTRVKILINRTHDSSYWKDIGTIDSYYEVNMELLGVDPPFNLYGEKWPFRAYERSLPPSKFVFGGRSPDSMVADGCIISGGVVWKSILSPGVVVERDASVEESIVLDDVSIEPGARVRRAIIDTDVRVKSGALIGYDLEADARKGCMISDSGIVVVPGGMVVGLD